jgi:sn-glycerol 3-phosphate transport system substrate-binding protein
MIRKRSAAPRRPSLTGALALAGLLGLALPAGAAPAKKAKAPPAAQPERCEGIELTHQLGADKSAALEELVTRFNETSKDCQIRVSARSLQAGTQSGLMILGGEEEERFLTGAPRYRPLHEVMKAAGEPLQTLRPPAMMTRRPVDAQGRLLALPVALSTPVLYINQEAFRKVGLNPDQPPQTWFDLQQALGQLIDSGVRCPYTVANPGRVIIDNTSAWHNEPTVLKQSKGKGKGETHTLSINGMLQIKHVALMASWYRSSYLHIFGRGAEAEQRFTAGECAVIAAPSSSWIEFRRQARFPVTVSTLPYHDDYPGAPHNTLLDGASMWVAAGRPAPEYKTIARFVRFWLEPHNQVAWQRDTGFLPLNRAGVAAAQQSELLKDELESVRVAGSQVSRKPATEASSANGVTNRAAVQRIVDEELEAVWADRKPAKEALDTAVARVGTLN